MDELEEQLSKKAIEYFRSGYNCAESVLMTMQEAWKMGKISPKIATAFGGGIGRRGSVCGSVTARILEINLKYGRTKATGDKEKAYAFADKFIKQSKDTFGSEICSNLIECDLWDPKDRKKLSNLNIFQEKCIKFVMKAVEILLELDE